MNSCREDGVRERSRAGIEAADPARDRHIRKTNREGHLSFDSSSHHKHPPRDMSSSQTGHCYSGIDESESKNNVRLRHLTWIVCLVESYQAGFVVRGCASRGGLRAILFH
eukprot:gene2011-biopygen11232